MLAPWAPVAVSIRQPHPYAILNLGKRFENREDSRGMIPTICRHVGPVLLHASGGMTMKEFWGALSAWRDDGRITRLQYAELLPTRKTLARGGIVGYARAIGRVDPDGYFHAPGERPRCAAFLKRERGYDFRWWGGGATAAYGHALVLDDVRELPFLACPGQLGVWKVPADVMRRLEQAGRRFDRCGNLLYPSDRGWVMVPS